MRCGNSIYQLMKPRQNLIFLIFVPSAIKTSVEVFLAAEEAQYSSSQYPSAHVLAKKGGSLGLRGAFRCSGSMFYSAEIMLKSNAGLLDIYNLLLWKMAPLQNMPFNNPNP